MKRPSVVKETRVKVRDIYVLFVRPADARTEYGPIGQTIYARPTKRSDGCWLVFNRGLFPIALLTENADDWSVQKVTRVARPPGPCFEVKASIHTEPTFQACLEYLTR